MARLQNRLQNKSILSGSKELNRLVFRYVKSVEEQGNESRKYVFLELNDEWKNIVDKLNKRLKKNMVQTALEYKAFETAINDKKYIRSVKIALGYYTPFDVKLKNYLKNIFGK